MENFLNWENISKTFELNDFSKIDNINYEVRIDENLHIKHTGDLYLIGEIEHHIDPVIYRNYNTVYIPRHEKFLFSLEILSKLLKIFGQRGMNKYYCAISSTLLGIIRDNGFIPTNSDLDLLILKELHKDIFENINIYNEALSPCLFVCSWIGFKIIINDLVIIDLYVYDERDNHYIMAGPIINNISYFVVNERFPFCNFHKSIMLPIRENEGIFENLKINIPNYPEKVLEINFSKDTLNTEIIITNNKYDLTRVFNQHLFLTSPKLTGLFGKSRKGKLPQDFFNIVNENLYRTQILAKYKKINPRGKKECYLTIVNFDSFEEKNKRFFQALNDKKFKIILVYDDDSLKDIKSSEIKNNLDVRINNIKNCFKSFRQNMEELLIYKIYNIDPSYKLEEVIKENQYLFDFTFVTNKEIFSGIEIINKFNIPIEIK